jgi:hypothetical protein
VLISAESSFSSIFCLITIGQSYVLSVPVCSDVVFQPVHYIASLKNLTAASVSSFVLREIFEVSLFDEVSEVVPVCMSMA